jgi:tau tubulin kinase
MFCYGPLIFLVPIALSYRGAVIVFGCQLKLEVAVLKKVQPSPYACRFVTCGRYGDYNYLVMELLGANLAELRRNVPDGKFSMTTTLKCGIHFIRALESIHDFGFVHRDVKPSNFVIGPTPETSGNIYVIDYGLARRYVDANGVIKSSRDQSGFRGTARYASINSHLSKDLGRRDDLWSVFCTFLLHNRFEILTSG